MQNLHDLQDFEIPEELLDEQDSEDGVRGEGAPLRLDDAHIGPYIADNYLQDYLHAPELGWLRFDGCRWGRVSEETVAETIRQAVIDFHNEEANRSGPEVNRLKRIDALLSANRITALLRIVRNYRSQRAEDFDTHPDLLNVLNGVVDLRTGTLEPHNRDLLLTKVALARYEPKAVHADWDKALQALPDMEAVAWMQLRFGQAITGNPTPDDRLPVLKGSGANGKTTILDAIRETLGADYAVTMPERVLLARQGDHPTELMTLRGARLAIMEEFPELGHLNVKRLKDLLGTGEMTARYCGKDSVSWKPTHSPFVTTNYLPRVDESDDGTWRRLVLVPFPYRYRRTNAELRNPSDKLGDPNLRDRLRNGREGQREAVLSWLITGAIGWYQNDRVIPEEPESIRAATGQWRRSSDLLMRFIDDSLIFDPQSHVATTELYTNFIDWLDAANHRSWTDQNFNTRFGNHSLVTDNGLAKKRVRKSKPGLSRPPGLFGQPRNPSRPLPDQFTAWVGVRFRTKDDADADDDEE